MDQSELCRNPITRSSLALSRSSIGVWCIRLHQWWNLRSSESFSPFSFPYPPKLVEEKFSEVRGYAQFPSICSSDFTFQWAGGLRSGGSRVFLSPFVSSNCSWVRSTAPVR
jgi:hypothetical protein